MAMKYRIKTLPFAGGSQKSPPARCVAEHRPTMPDATGKGAWPPLSAQEGFPVLNTGCNPACRTAAATSPPGGRRGWRTAPAPPHPLGIATRLGARLGGHLGDAKAHCAVAKGGGLAGGEGQIQRGREEAPGADQLGQLAIRHDHGRLQPAGAGAQAREGERIAALPVVALKPAQMLGDKVAVGAPVRGETDERPNPILSIPARPSRSGVARRHAMSCLLPRR